QAVQTAIAEVTMSAPIATQAPPASAVPTLVPTEIPPGPTPDPNLPVAMLPAPGAGDPAAVARYNTVIMGGPGKNYVVYGAFLGGQAATVIGKSEDGLWWAVSIPVAPDGAGWADAAWVNVQNADGVPVLPAPPVPATTDLVKPGPDNPQATTLANTYVRAGPGTNYAAYGVANAGLTGWVIGKSVDGSWWVVRVNPEKVGVGYGWVSAQYASAKNVQDVQTIQSPQAPASIVQPTPAPGAASGTNTTAVNVRSGPGTNYPILAVAPAGSTGEITGKSADGVWWQVKVPTQISASGFGWVSAGYGYTQNTQNVPVVEAPPAPPVVEPTPPPITATGCTLVNQTPPDASVEAAGSQFTTVWVLKNSSTSSWSQADYDISYVGAVDNIPLHVGSDVYDLTTNVDPGWTYYFYMPMLAPYDPGTYGELWQVASGSQVVCQFWIYINVK
ncbi:MAG: hypothetical protein C3F13_06540, partial [Anaerolineales bacterium]